jgi:hypothetical protein
VPGSQERQAGIGKNRGQTYFSLEKVFKHKQTAGIALGQGFPLTRAAGACWRRVPISALAGT